MIIWKNIEKNKLYQKIIHPFIRLTPRDGSNTGASIYEGDKRYVYYKGKKMWEKDLYKLFLDLKKQKTEKYLHERGIPTEPFNIMYEKGSGQEKTTIFRFVRKLQNHVITKPIKPMDNSMVINEYNRCVELSKKIEKNEKIRPIYDSKDYVKILGNHEKNENVYELIKNYDIICENSEINEKIGKVVKGYEFSLVKEPVKTFDEIMKIGKSYKRIRELFKKIQLNINENNIIDDDLIFELKKVSKDLIEYITKFEKKDKNELITLIEISKILINDVNIFLQDHVEDFKLSDHTRKTWVELFKNLFEKNSKIMDVNKWLNDFLKIRENYKNISDFEKSITDNTLIKNKGENLVFLWCDLKSSLSLLKIYTYWEKKSKIGLMEVEENLNEFKNKIMPEVTRKKNVFIETKKRNDSVYNNLKKKLDLFWETKKTEFGYLWITKKEEIEANKKFYEEIMFYLQDNKTEDIYLESIEINNMFAKTYRYFCAKYKYKDLGVNVSGNVENKMDNKLLMLNLHIREKVEDDFIIFLMKKLYEYICVHSVSIYWVCLFILIIIVLIYVYKLKGKLKKKK